MKTAFYGGAFNPVHTEHVNIVRAAIENLGLDKVIISPTFISPHKSGSVNIPARERLALCKLAFADVPQAEVSDEEIKRGGVSYSFVTCRALKRKYPDDELYFLMGEDMLSSFGTWKNPEEILKCVRLAVCGRGDGDLNGAIRAFSARFGREAVKVGYTGKEVSSTFVRTLAALGEDLSGLTPKPVAKYIRERGLYARRDLQAVKKLLTPERWAHTVRVAVCATENARRAGVDESDALCAAALHDCAKYLGADSEYLAGFVPPDGVPAPVMHQYAGAFVAKNAFGITDKNVLNAIAYHTSGRPCMGKLEKLIYLSDLLESGRDFEGVDGLRAAFERDIDEALEAALRHQIEYLKTTGKPVYPLTEKAYNYVKENKL